MIEIDCGREYIALDDSDQVERAKAFAIELLDNRLKAASYRGTAATLIGPSEWPEGSLGRALTEKKEGRILDQYHGLECIAGVCSGDVSPLLLVYRRIFDAGGVTKDSTSRVPSTTQHTAIVGASRELFEAIKRHFPRGPEMYGVVAAFGNLIRNILQLGRWQTKGTSTTPPQCPRIEIDQKEGAAEDTLTPEQQQLARELIRRAIFIEMDLDDNAVNLSELESHLCGIATNVELLEADAPDFPSRLRMLLELVISEAALKPPRVTVDISVAANRLFLRCMKVGMCNFDMVVRVQIPPSAPSQS